jgi:hypothetical protein
MTARWFARNGFLAQFQVANEIDGENTECYNPFDPLV